MKRITTIIAAIVMAFGVFAQETDFSSFTIADQVSSTVNATEHTVQVWMPQGTDFTELVASFTIETGAEVFIGEVAQVSGTTVNDFSEDVTYTIKNGEASQDWVVSVDFWTSIKPAEALQVSVYPNPTTDYVNVEGAENAAITVFNILGKVVKTEYSFDNKYQVDLSNLTKGTYLISVQKDNERITKKVSLLK